ncbi:MAG: cysteine hydrolase family protein [Parvibaculaceae bacterium]
MSALIIDAKPRPVEIDPARTALIIIDMQNDFGAKGGMFDRAGVDILGIREAIVPTARVLAGARKSGLLVVHLKTGYRPDLSDLGGEDAPNRTLHLRIFGVGREITSPDGVVGRILVRDTWGTDIVPELRPRAGEVVITKTRFSGFYQTELEAVLRTANVKHLIVTGCTTSVCVESTIRDAFFRDFHCLLLTDCTSEPIARDTARSNYDASLALVERLFGWTSTSARFLRAVGGDPTQ